jgi:transcriptional regulator with XRE-family HTH domain
MMTFGEKIQSIRLEKGLTQARLAERAGIGQGALSNIEKGRRDFTVSTLVRLCSALGVPVQKVFESGPRSPKRRWITRERVERLARAVWGSAEPLNRKERETARLLGDVVPLGKKAKNQKQILRAWNELRKRHTNGEIRILTERVRGEENRRHAKKSY